MKKVLSRLFIMLKLPSTKVTCLGFSNLYFGNYLLVPYFALSMDKAIDKFVYDNVLHNLLLSYNSPFIQEFKAVYTVLPFFVFLSPRELGDGLKHSARSK